MASFRAAVLASLLCAASLASVPGTGAECLAIPAGAPSATGMACAGVDDGGSVQAQASLAAGTCLEGSCVQAMAGAAGSGATPVVQAGAEVCAVTAAFPLCVLDGLDSGDESGELADCRAATPPAPEDGLDGAVAAGERCVPNVPSGTVGVVGGVVVGCMFEPAGCRVRSLPLGAVVAVEYRDGGWAFVVSAGWDCHEDFHTYEYFRAICRTVVPGEWSCANFHTETVVGGSTGAQAVGTTECDGYQAVCLAEVGRLQPCDTAFTPAAANLQPPLLCSLSLRHWTGTITSARTVCYNDP